MVVLDWDESFSMQGNVTSPGYQRMVLQGLITENRHDGVYAAPLLPQLFYGADGNQLSTWRQYISGTGQQTILSRSGGLPTIPKQDLYWRKIPSRETRTPEQTAPKTLPKTPILAIAAGITVLYLLLKD